MDDEEATHQRRITSDNVKIGSPAERIVKKFGGLVRFCELCDFKVSTVHNWMRGGLIPAKWRDGVSYQAWILRRAEEHDIDLAADDFIEHQDG